MTNNLNDYGKLLVLLIALVGALAYAMVGLVTHEAAAQIAGFSLAGTVVGYVTGNGRLAVRKEPPSPLLSPVLDNANYVHKDDLQELDEIRSMQLRRAQTFAKGEPRGSTTVDP